MTIIGYVPEEIVFIYSLSKQVGEVEVFPAYIADSKNEKTIESGESWAKYCGYSKEERKVKKEKRKNSPIKNIQILELEYRGEGGRAYKVFIPNGEFYIDLREDVLMDIILNVGISPGGVLNGEYVFGVVGSQMKIMRVGSELHSEIIKSGEEKNKKKIKNSELIVGHSYSGRNG